MRIHYYLDLDDKTHKIKCRKCGQDICHSSENYKLHVPRADVYPDEIYGVRPPRETATVIYHEYYCPGCYTMLDVEVSEPDAPPMWDIQIAVPQPGK